MIIIENDLTVEEGVEREKYWINEYIKNSPYNVLNKTKGGQVGCFNNLSDEEREKQRQIMKTALRVKNGGQNCSTWNMIG